MGKLIFTSDKKETILIVYTRFLQAKGLKVTQESLTSNPEHRAIFRQEFLKDVTELNLHTKKEIEEAFDQNF